MREREREGGEREEKERERERERERQSKRGEYIRMCANTQIEYLPKIIVPIYLRSLT